MQKQGFKKPRLVSKIAPKQRLFNYLYFKNGIRKTWIAYHSISFKGILTALSSVPVSNSYLKNFIWINIDTTKTENHNSFLPFFGRAI